MSGERKKDRGSCIQGKRRKNTWGKEGPYMRGKAGRGRILGVN